MFIIELNKLLTAIGIAKYWRYSITRMYVVHRKHIIGPRAGWSLRTLTLMPAVFHNLLRKLWKKYTDEIWVLLHVQAAGFQCHCTYNWRHLHMKFSSVYLCSTKFLHYVTLKKASKVKKPFFWKYLSKMLLFSSFPGPSCEMQCDKLVSDFGN
jgi:hypothetical protein